MPFGLINSPTTFMRLMNEILRLFSDDCVLVFLDYIIVQRKAWEEHVQHLQAVLEVLKKVQLKLNLKCIFQKTSLSYLVHVTGGGEVKLDPASRISRTQQSCLSSCKKKGAQCGMKIRNTHLENLKTRFARHLSQPCWIWRCCLRLRLLLLVMPWEVCYFRGTNQYVSS